MSSPDRERMRALVRAFAARRDSAAEAKTPMESFAADVIADRQEALRVRCPDTVLRRAQQLFGEAEARRAGGVLRVIFDSWRQADAPRVRGPGRERLVRLVSGSKQVDVMFGAGAERGRLEIAATPGAQVALRVPPATRARRVRLDGEGLGHVTLPRRAREVILRLDGVESERISLATVCDDPGLFREP